LAQSLSEVAALEVAVAILEVAVAALEGPGAVNWKVVQAKKHRASSDHVKD